jgi:hypothetical protein
MRNMKRLALALSIVSFSIAGAAVPAAAASPGVFTSSGIGASYSRFPEDFSVPHIQLSLSDSTNTFAPQGGPATSTRQTQLFVSVFNGTDYGEGCFILAAADFTIASDLSSASVHKTVDENSATCYSPASFQFPQTIDVTWTGIGSVRSQQETGHSSCQSYHLDTKSSRSTRGASSTASISPILGEDSFGALQAGIDMSSNKTQVQGSPPPLCMAGGGRGVGAGPVGAGTYRTSLAGANQQLSNAETGDAISILAGTSSYSSNPRVGPSSSVTESTVTVRMNGPSFDRSCWVISPDAFTINNNLTGASVHVTVTEDTPACPGPFSNTIPLPLTIDMTWTGIGPAAMDRTNNQSDCGGYRTDLSATGRNNNTSAVATLSGAIEGTFVSQQSEHESSGSMGALDQTIQVRGDPSACAS